MSMRRAGSLIIAIKLADWSSTRKEKLWYGFARKTHLAQVCGFRCTLQPPGGYQDKAQRGPVVCRPARYTKLVLPPERGGHGVSWQGLELGLPIVCWEYDFLGSPGRWQGLPPPGSKAYDPQRLQVDSYRVLLSREHAGVVVLIPGNSA
jgi:hypothetical protein